MPSTEPIDYRQFCSDNYAGICPEAWSALAQANQGYAASYGNCDWTARARRAFYATFDSECAVFFPFNGTAANSLALAALCPSYRSIICADSAHVETDECGAPAFFSNGAKLLVAATPTGKLTSAAITAIATSRSDIHFPRPQVVAISQPTETGQIYTVDEIRTISCTCRDLGLRLYMDGARFANACAALGCTPADITWRAGVDVLCCGGIKNGMEVGEALLFFDRSLAEGFEYRCKQAGQLASKMRFLTAPWVGMLESGAWLNNARHSNACALRFRDRIARLDEVTLIHPVETNAVFLGMSDAAAARLRGIGWHFYTSIGGFPRFMFSWNSLPAHVDVLADDLHKACDRQYCQ